MSRTSKPEVSSVRKPRKVLPPRSQNLQSSGSNGINFSLANLSKKRIPDVPFRDIKEKVLGKSYELSLVFVPPALAKELNQKHRKAEYVPNVLSFPLSKTSGEIFICPTIAKAEAPKFERTADEFLADLFIHGLFHLKGLAHGSKMERQEARIRTLFRL